MRLVSLVSLLVAVAAPTNDARGQHPFPWSSRFPLGFPPISRPFPEFDSENAFRIGSMIFTYNDSAETKTPTVATLQNVEPVAEVVRACSPDAALSLLVEQQLGSAHRFELRQVMLRNLGDQGFVWSTTWDLLPEKGGFSGEPYRYVSRKKAGGSVMPPTRSLYDEYVLHDSPTASSTIHALLTLDPKQILAEQVPKLSEAQIKDRACEAVTKALDEARQSVAEQIAEHLPRTLDVLGQEEIRIPIALGEDGQTQFRTIWATRFGREATRTKPFRSIGKFTVCTTEEGTMSRVKVVVDPTSLARHRVPAAPGLHGAGPP